MNIYSDIVEKLNEILAASIKPFIDGDTDTIKLFGLANSYVMENDSTAPMVNVNGELSYLLKLDYPITGYHRLTETTFNLDKTKSFGTKKHIAVKNNLSFTVIGKRATLNTDPETLALSISSQLYDVSINLPKAKGETLATSFTTDPLNILKSEFQGKDYDFKYNNPDYFFIKINYSLTLEMIANCLTC